MEEDGDEDDHQVVVLAKKAPERKTKQERKKAEKLRAEVCDALGAMLNRGFILGPRNVP